MLESLNTVCIKVLRDGSSIRLGFNLKDAIKGLYLPLDLSLKQLKLLVLVVFHNAVVITTKSLIQMTMRTNANSF